MLVGAFVCFAMGWLGGGDAKVAAASRYGSVSTICCTYLVYASLFGGALTLLLLQFRQWPLPFPFTGQPWLLGSTQAERHSLRHRARHRRVDGLPGDGMDQGGRPHPFRDALIGGDALKQGNSPLRQFTHAPLTML